MTKLILTVVVLVSGLNAFAKDAPLTEASYKQERARLMKAYRSDFSPELKSSPFRQQKLDQINALDKRWNATKARLAKTEQERAEQSRAAFFSAIRRISENSTCELSEYEYQNDIRVEDAGAGVSSGDCFITLTKASVDRNGGRYRNIIYAQVVDVTGTKKSKSAK